MVDGQAAACDLSAMVEMANSSCWLCLALQEAEQGLKGLGMCREALDLADDPWAGSHCDGLLHYQRTENAVQR